MLKKDKNKQTTIKIFLLGAASALIINYVFIALFLPIKFHESFEEKSLALVNTVNAAEIYPEFLCTCCDKPLDPDNICCGIMASMIDYIDQEIDNGSSKDIIMMDMVKKFGLKSLSKDDTKKEIQKILLAQAPKDSPRIVLSNTSKDLGDVNQSQGVVNTLFELKNEGSGDLIINNLNTSCMCTSASIIYKGKEGPIFNMDMPKQGKANPRNWQVDIAPGDTAQIKIYYDPMAHGKQKENSLDITRTVSIFSNDPIDFEKELKIELTQLP